MPFRTLLRSRLALTLWLVAALLWAPIWGQWHGIVHQVQQGLGFSAPVQSLSDSAVSRAKAPDHGHELGSALCQVLDHLGHASALATGVFLADLARLPLAAPAAKWRDGLAQADWQPAQARAPPHRI
jgi:hypothetical protein